MYFLRLLYGILNIVVKSGDVRGGSLLVTDGGERWRSSDPGRPPLRLAVEVAGHRLYQQSRHRSHGDSGLEDHAAPKPDSRRRRLQGSRHAAGTSALVRTGGFLFLTAKSHFVTVS